MKNKLETYKLQLRYRAKHARQAALYVLLNYALDIQYNIGYYALVLCSAMHSVPYTPPLQSKRSLVRIVRCLSHGPLSWVLIIER